jgi:hypothetical protein
MTGGIIARLVDKVALGKNNGQLWKRELTRGPQGGEDVAWAMSGLFASHGTVCAAFRNIADQSNDKIIMCIDTVRLDMEYYET